MEITGLIKIGEKEHLEQLLFEGHLYMNTLGYFRECEGISQDKNEGAKNILQGAKTRLFMIPRNGSGGSVSMRYKNFIESHFKDLDKNVFCMHAFFSKDAFFDSKNLKRNDFALLIFDGIAFFQMLDSKKQNKGNRLSYELVEYVDGKTYQGELGPFKKFEEFKGNNYKNENEFRILLEPGKGKATDIYLGNIEKIACIVAVKDLIETMEEKYGLKIIGHPVERSETGC